MHAGRLQFGQKMLGRRIDVTGGAATGHHHIFGDICFTGQWDDFDVIGLIVIQGFFNQG